MVPPSLTASENTVFLASAHFLCSGITKLGSVLVNAVTFCTCVVSALVALCRSVDCSSFVYLMNKCKCYQPKHLLSLPSLLVLPDNCFHYNDKLELSIFINGSEVRIYFIPLSLHSIQEEFLNATVL
jgi:hypothetical protein